MKFLPLLLLPAGYLLAEALAALRRRLLAKEVTRAAWRGQCHWEQGVLQEEFRQRQEAAQVLVSLGAREAEILDPSERG